MSNERAGGGNRSLHRRRLIDVGARQAWITSFAAVGGAVTLVAGLAACGPATAGSAPPQRPAHVVVLPSEPVRAAPGAVGTSVFVSVRDLPGSHDRSAIVLSDAATGGIIGQVLADPYRGMGIDSTAVGPGGSIWVAASSGPACTSDVAGCGPRPRSCRSAVLRIDPSTGRVTTILSLPPTELVTDATPSADGRYLAMVTGSCTRSFLDQHVAVRTLSTGRTWTIGAGLRVCHSLGPLTWDGPAQLAAAYGASTVGPHQVQTNDGEGLCNSPAPAGLRVFDALVPQAGLIGHGAPPAPGCNVEAATTTAGGFAAVEACGGSDFLSGPARLVLFDDRLRPTGSQAMGRCLDGAYAATDRSGRSVLVSSYEYCNPPGTVSPHTMTFVERGGRRRVLIDAPNGGADLLSDVSW